MKKNKKGFTLVELLATIIVLAIVVGITIPLTLSSINKAKEKELQILIKNIQSAAGNYAVECNYGGTIDSAKCRNTDPILASKTVKLSTLIELGFLANSNGCNSVKNDSKQKNKVNVGGKIDSGRSSSANSEYCLYDPVNETNLSNCEIYVYDNGSYGYCAPVVGTNSPPDMCPIDAISNVPEECLVLFNND